MNKELLEQEIKLLEGRLVETKASKPAHDTSGSHQAALLEIEDELFEKRQALDSLNELSKSKSAEKDQ